MPLSSSHSQLAQMVSELGKKGMAPPGTILWIHYLPICLAWKPRRLKCWVENDPKGVKGRRVFFTHPAFWASAGFPWADDLEIVSQTRASQEPFSFRSNPERLTVLSHVLFLTLSWMALPSGSPIWAPSKTKLTNVHKLTPNVYSAEKCQNRSLYNK